ncbi:MAG: AI-2E family transporter [Anaerolineales bacterium]|nr:AI-2E family transporter [Anaerolineales bacterium]
MIEQPPTPTSPAWGANTKLVVALTGVVIIGALLVKFQFILSPLLISLLLAYLLHPLAIFFRQKLRLSWGASVSIVYFLFVIFLVSLLAWGSVSLIQQGQSLITVAQNGLTALPQFIQEYSGKIYQMGPFAIDLRAIDLSAISRQALDMVQPLLSKTGTLLGSLAGGAANFFGWTIFVIFVSYFIVAESGGLRSQIVAVDLPGYTHDIQRLTRELSRIWNAFMRGQIIIFFMTIAIYAVALEALGVRYTITLALIAGLARFLPYIGPAINWIILALVAYFQEYHLFGMSPFYYMLLILVITIVFDMAIDYVITPRIYSDTLQVHPAAVLVAAIVAATLFGALGVVVAAPILASAMLLWRYVTRKMLDINPWLPEDDQRPQPPPLADTLRRVFIKFKLNLKTRK